jgi:predicted ester cyclase
MMTAERTRQVLMQYWEAHDVSKLDEKAVFTVMGTGQQAKGREAIGQFLQYLYHVAFEARADLKHTVIADGQASFEADLVGKQLLEFGGIAPTDEEVRVPFCVVYELVNDLITQGRIYFETDALRRQSDSR